MDSPGGRKIHTEHTPSIGGVPIFLGIIFSIMLWLPLSYIAEFKYLISALVICFILGLRDDLTELRAGQKLIGQIGAASLLIFFYNIRLTSLYGLFGIYDIPFWLSFVLTSFTFIVVTNAFNLIDGIDGLAGTLGLMALLFFGTWFLMIDRVHFSFFCFTFAGAMLAFLNYNWSPSKIFMGDTGSLLIGFFLSAATIYFIDSNYKLPADSSFKFNGFVGSGVGIIIIPLYDTIRVFIKRVMAGKSPMHPDKNHVHHVLLKLGFGHAGATVILIITSLVFIGLVIGLRDYSDKVVLTMVLSLALMLGVILDSIFSQKLKSVRKQSDKSKETKQIYLNKSA
ncbi:MAG: MraY family glycosyltransferase [Cyclobacteriaceae bacterium]